MPPLVLFIFLFVGSLVVSRFRHWPLPLALVDATGLAVAVTLVVFGEELPLSYVAKALLIALGAGASMWVLGRMSHANRAKDTAAGV